VHNLNIKRLSSLDLKDEEINDVFYGLSYCIISCLKPRING